MTELNFTFGQKLHFGIAEVFPNLRKLSLNNEHKLYMKYPTKGLDFLEELYLCQANMTYIPKSVKKLHFACTTFTKFPIFDVDYHIEKLTIYSCKNLGWLPEFFAANKVPLTTLKLAHVSLKTDEARAILNQQIGKIKNEYVKFIKVQKDMKEKLQEILNESRGNYYSRD